MKEKWLAFLKSMGWVTDANEAEVKQKLTSAGLDVDPVVQPIDTTKLSPELKLIFDSLNTRLSASEEKSKQLLDALTKEREERDKGVQAQQALSVAEKKKKIDEFVVKALADGKINEAGKEQLVKDAEANFELAQRYIAEKSVIAGFKPAKDAKDVKKTEEGGGKTIQPPTGDTRLNKILEFSQAQTN